MEDYFESFSEDIKKWVLIKNMIDLDLDDGRRKDHKTIPSVQLLPRRDVMLYGTIPKMEQRIYTKCKECRLVFNPRDILSHKTCPGKSHSSTTLSLKKKVKSKGSTTKKPHSNLPPPPLFKKSPSSTLTAASVSIPDITLAKVASPKISKISTISTSSTITTTSSSSIKSDTRVSSSTSSKTNSHSPRSPSKTSSSNSEHSPKSKPTPSDSNCSSTSSSSSRHKKSRKSNNNTKITKEFETDVHCGVVENDDGRRKDHETIPSVQLLPRRDVLLYGTIPKMEQRIYTKCKECRLVFNPRDILSHKTCPGKSHSSTSLSLKKKVKSKGSTTKKPHSNLPPPPLFKKSPTSTLTTASVSIPDISLANVASPEISKISTISTSPTITTTSSSSIKSDTRTRKSNNNTKITKDFDPDVHCGVVEGNRGPCTRSITCNNHRIQLRKLVAGRSKDIHQLIAERKTVKEIEPKHGSNCSYTSPNGQAEEIQDSFSQNTTYAPVVGALSSASEPPETNLNQTPILPKITEPKPTTPVRQTTSVVAPKQHILTDTENGNTKTMNNNYIKNMHLKNGDIGAVPVVYMPMSVISDIQQCSTPEDERYSSNEAGHESDAENTSEDVVSQSYSTQAKLLNRLPRHKQLASMFEKTVNKLQQIVELTAADTEDQYDQFAKHLASQLRQLPLRSFILLQSKIQNLITEERLANLNASNIAPLSQCVDISHQNSKTVYSESSDTCFIEEEMQPSISQQLQGPKNMEL